MPSDELDNELSEDDCEVVEETNAKSAPRVPTKKLAPTKRTCALWTITNKRESMALKAKATTTRGKKERAEEEVE